MSSSNSTPCSEKVRAAIACFRAATPQTDKLFVQLEIAHYGVQNPQPPKRVAARRIYSGDNKALDGKFTVVVGADLSTDPPQPVALTIHDRTVDVTVAATPFGGATAPFEGVFDLRSVEIDKTR